MPERRLSPLAEALYGVIFEPEPQTRARAAAEYFYQRRQFYSEEWLKGVLLREIRNELEHPGQKVKDILNSSAGEEDLRDYLRLFAKELESLFDKEPPRRG
jgi:hypothetical protein